MIDIYKGRIAIQQSVIGTGHTSLLDWSLLLDQIDQTAITRSAEKGG